MKEKIEIIIAVVILVFLILVAMFLGWLGLIGVIVLMAGYALNWIKKIPADPPHVGIRTYWGKRTPERGIISEGKDKGRLSEGIHFFPFYPWLYGYIAVNITKKNREVAVQKVRSRDNAELKIPIGITISPDPANLINYLNSGGESGVFQIMEDVVSQELRQWAREIGTWEDALSANDDATDRLMRAIAGEQYTGKTEDERNKEKDKARNGHANIPIKEWGIILNRLNVEDIELQGELARVAELKAKELAERDGERAEMEHIKEMIQNLTKPIEEGGGGLTKEQAVELMQTERNKISKTIQEYKISSSEGIKNVVEGLGLDKFLNKK